MSSGPSPSRQLPVASEAGHKHSYGRCTEGPVTAGNEVPKEPADRSLNHRRAGQRRPRLVGFTLRAGEYCSRGLQCQVGSVRARLTVAGRSS